MGVKFFSYTGKENCTNLLSHTRRWCIIKSPMVLFPRHLREELNTGRGRLKDRSCEKLSPPIIKKSKEGPMHV
ncbi:hypothetical protein BaRGS_00029526, partial [Batillaria attramentaria]